MDQSNPPRYRCSGQGTGYFPDLLGLQEVPGSEEALGWDPGEYTGANVIIAEMNAAARRAGSAKTTSTMPPGLFVNGTATADATSTTS